MNESETTGQEKPKVGIKSIISDETLAVVVCETCDNRVVAQLGQGKFDAEIALLEINLRHKEHELVTFDRKGRDGKYRERRGVCLKTEYIQ